MHRQPGPSRRTDAGAHASGSTMGKGITRRDFFDGVACAIVASSVAPGLSYARGANAPYPPARTGYGGSRARGFSFAHGGRDGGPPDLPGQPGPQRYDGVVSA